MPKAERTPEAKHTPEPWHYDPHPPYTRIYGGIPEGAERDYEGQSKPGYDLVLEDGDYLLKRDARRIVACVNACAGIKTEHLEEIVRRCSAPGIVVPDFAAVFEKISAFMNQTIDEVVQQANTAAPLDAKPVGE